MREEKDKNLADKGWQSMQQILDREMPAERKRRPVAWWWWGTALLLLLPMLIWGSRSWRNSTPVQHPEIQPVTKSDRPIVQHIEETATATETATAPTIQENSMEVVATPSQPVQRPYQSSGQNAVHNKRRYSPTAKTETVSDIHITTVETVDNQENRSNVTTSVLEQKTEETLRDIGFTQTLPLPFDEAEREQTISLEMPHADIIRPAETSSKKTPDSSSRWSFGIAASAATEQFVSLNGFTGGAVTDFRLSRKWGLRSGLAYARYLPSSSKQPVVAVEEVRYTNATGVFTGSNGYDPVANPSTGEALPPEYVYVPLRKLHQIEMPLLAWWEPVRRLRLYSGVAVGYTFSGQSSGQNYINNQLVALDSEFSLKNAGRVATTELPRWQVHYQGGLGIGLGRHLELSAFWRTPFPSVALEKREVSADVLNSGGSQFLSNTSNTTVLPGAARFILQGVWKF